MRKILITDNPQAREFSQKLHPRIIISRKDIPDIDALRVTDALLDGTDTEILNVFINATALSYAPQALDFSTDIDKIRLAIKNMAEYKISVDLPPLPSIEDDFITTGATNGLPVVSAPPPDSEHDEIPMREQIALLHPLIERKKIGAGSIALLTEQLVDLCRDNELFMRDKITGLFKSRFARRPLISEWHAQTIFETHFVDKLATEKVTYGTDKETGTQTKKVTYQKISRADLDLLWRNIKMQSIFNSRRQFYERIPAWDKTPRIMTFMKKYFECDTNPNFFLLLMTAIIGKIIAPEKAYCPHFFDIVSSSKGIGKSLLCRRLIGWKYCGFLSMTARKDDFFVNAYDGNNIIVVDDECTWMGKGFDKISYDEFKSMVILPTDKFSRKFQQPEEHDRCFVIMRTSNYVNQVFSTNERRQIIFQSGLKEQECRILDLPDSFFEQMLAEAKEYYEKNGMYKLTDNDKLEVKDANLDNYNWETEENFTIMDYAQAVRDNPHQWGVKLVAEKFADGKWGTYKKYCDWCEANKKRSATSRAFWRNVAALSELDEHHIEVLSEQKYEMDNGVRSRVFRIDPIKAVKTDKTEDVPNIPY